MDGRILSEALNGRTQTEKPAFFELNMSFATGSSGARQYVKCSQVGGTVYFEEGNHGDGLTPPSLK